jgi:hypothetical protein
MGQVDKKINLLYQRRESNQNWFVEIKAVKLLNSEECTNKCDLMKKQIELRRNKETCGMLCILLATIVSEAKNTVGDQKE